MPHDFSGDAPWAEGVYDEGYGPDQLELIKHTRRVILKSNDEIEIIDDFASKDGKAHSIEILFHCLTDDAAINDETLRTSGDHTNAELTWHSRADIEAFITCGGGEPDLRGWAEPDGLQDGKLEVTPRPCLTLKLSCEESVRVSTVFRVIE